ncbi:HAD-like domain-containing protein [Pisolithus orientalis]|uniref:HAD-like domain-containing protein n=1 Tax=Pisolithus orientalis TaxID=936130 RepID=UPI0022254F20|nr:HAD-like domain-containing protein [Pisolithus orientalis]KAI6028562.1 HAD-like domain-containing protein [Pisolithus orientalis]
MMTCRQTTYDGLNAAEETWIHLSFSWAGKTFSLDLAESDRVYDLKAALLSLTNVPPERQKILGLVRGKLPSDEGRISDLRITPGKNFILVGTSHLETKSKTPPVKLESLPDVVNDLDVDVTGKPSSCSEFEKQRRNSKSNLINPLREGKRLLVLDLDYTILDTKPLTSGSLPPAECARPGLHEFLEDHIPILRYMHLTTWVWLEAKLVELGMIGSTRAYEVILDKTCMFTVFTERNGQPYTHHVKPLQIIWNKFPQFSAKNTIHVDDLSRNFALNPDEGLKIHAFKHAHMEQAQADRELEKLARYMVHIASIDDFRTVNHKDWKRTLRNLARP